MNQFYYFQVFDNILLIVLDIWKKKRSNLNEYPVGLNRTKPFMNVLGLKKM